MRKVLLVAYHFPPVNIINSRRFNEMAHLMPNFGWEPLVLTTNSRGTLPVLIPEENIIRIGENYYKEGIVFDEGYRGIPFFAKFPYFIYKKSGMEIWSLDRFTFTWGRDVKKNKEKIENIAPDLISASCYPPASLWVGRFLSRELKKPWIADFQDPLSFWNNSKFPLIKFIDRKIDKYLIGSASGIVTISSYLGKKMENLYKTHVEVVYNGFDEPQEKNRKPYSFSGRIYYAGRFHQHRIPAIKMFIDWLAKDEKNLFNFTVRSLGPKETNDEILKYAKEKGILDKIEILPPAGPETILKEERSAGVLILFEDLNKMMPNSQGTLPGKFMEYLPFAAPILAITRSDSEIGNILKETRRGYLASNAKELAEIMRGIASGKNLEAADSLERYSRNYQCKKFCEFLNKIYESQIKC